VTGNSASHPVTGSPPSGMKSPTRLPKTSARRGPTCPDGPACEANPGVVRKTGGRVLPSARPAPQEPALGRHDPLHSQCHAGRSAVGEYQWRGIGVISLRYIMGKSPVSRPNTHRATADISANAQPAQVAGSQQLPGSRKPAHPPPPPAASLRRRRHRQPRSHQPPPPRPTPAASEPLHRPAPTSLPRRSLTKTGPSRFTVSNRRRQAAPVP
jgi:hypothetical protein